MTQPADMRDAEGGGEASPTHSMRLPRFLVHEPVGLGQVVQRVTSAAGIRPCASCARRAERLDRWMRVEPRR
jgi:hypothetical protein